MADTNLFVAKITFVMAGMTFKVAVITSSLANITFVVAEITFKVAVITSSLAKIIFVVTEITFNVAVIISVILHIHVKALDSEFQLISNILIHFKIWVLIGQTCETLSIFPSREISVKILRPTNM